MCLSKGIAMKRLAMMMCVALTILGSSGCGPRARKAPPGFPVKGTVYLHGVPMDQGEIRFERRGEPTKVAQISNGTFAEEALEGENRIEIYAYIDAPSPGVIGDRPTTKVNTVPAEFNTESTLKAVVTTGGANDFKFSSCKGTAIPPASIDVPSQSLS